VWLILVVIPAAVVIWAAISPKGAPPSPRPAPGILVTVPGPTLPFDLGPTTTLLPPWVPECVWEHYC
jgi:hypothetical protein